AALARLHGAECVCAAGAAAADSEREGGSAWIAGPGCRGIRAGGVRGAAGGDRGSPGADLAGAAEGRAGWTRGQLLCAGPRFAVGGGSGVACPGGARARDCGASGLRMPAPEVPGAADSTQSRGAGAAVDPGGGPRAAAVAVVCAAAVVVSESDDAAERGIQHA